MVSLIEALLLGVVQGLTEWIPISSSGHLVLIQELMQIEVPLFFDIILHLGTFTVILIYFRQDIFQILKAIFKLDFKSNYGRLGLLLILGNIPIVLTGLFFYNIIASFFKNPMLVGFALLATGSLLYISKYGNPNKKMNASESFIVGLAQAIAIIPGISRSGFTISVGLLRGISQQEIFRFSFLLAAPAILGATLFEYANLSFIEIETSAIIVGFSVSLVVGYFSLKLLSRLVETGRFHLFAYYCWIIGFIILLVTITQ